METNINSLKRLRARKLGIAPGILPHGGNLYREKVPAGLAVGNGHGKLTGGTQVAELGEIETPIVLTNTLAVPRAADAILDWTLGYPGNKDVHSVNAVVGETNDGRLNNVRCRVLTPKIIRNAIQTARSGPVEEGSVGAGTWYVLADALLQGLPAPALQ